MTLQRSAYTKKKLTPERAERLTALPEWSWAPQWLISGRKTSGA